MNSSVPVVERGTDVAGAAASGANIVRRACRCGELPAVLLGGQIQIRMVMPPPLNPAPDSSPVFAVFVPELAFQIFLLRQNGEVVHQQQSNYD